MSLKIGIIGVCGKMGKALLEEILIKKKQNPPFELVFGIGRPKSPKINDDLATLIHLPPMGIKVTKGLLAKADVAIDFSSAEAIVSLLPQLEEKKIPLIVGTTGLEAHHLKKMKESAKKIPILYSPNFSTGIFTLYRLVKKLALAFPKSSIDIIETHHQEKKDAPSGTAHLLAKGIEAAGHKNVKIHSIRAGKIPGEHVIHLATDDERIEIKHQALSRRAFALGALEAAKMLVNFAPGFYTIDDFSGSFFS